jgi:hypothetical protein
MGLPYYDRRWDAALPLNVIAGGGRAVGRSGGQCTSSRESASERGIYTDRLTGFQLPPT